MASNAIVRVVVHPTSKGWSWTQVSANGSAGAVAPKTYDSKSNARRAGERQADKLIGAVVTVVDKDPGYV